MKNIINPVVTVVIPCYNVEKYIEDAVNCILSQTFQDWELLLVDDKSTDNTLSIIRNYEANDKRIRVIALNRNTGGAHIPRTVAIKEAKGTWIYTLDADDYCDIDTLDVMYKRAIDTAADSVFQALQGVFEDKRLDPQRVLPNKSFDFSAVVTGKELFKMNIGQWQTNSNGTFAKKAIYIKSIEQGKEAYCGSYTDDLVGRYVFLNSKISAFVKVKYYSRFNPDSVTRNISIQRLEVLPAYFFISDLARKRFPDDPNLAAKAEVNSWGVVWMIAELYLRCYNQIRKSDRKVFRDTLQEYWQKIDARMLVKSFNFLKVQLLTQKFSVFLFCVSLRVTLSKIKHLIFD